MRVKYRDQQGNPHRDRGEPFSDGAGIRDRSRLFDSAPAMLRLRARALLHRPKPSTTCTRGMLRRRLCRTKGTRTSSGWPLNGVSRASRSKPKTIKAGPGSSFATPTRRPGPARRTRRARLSPRSSLCTGTTRPRISGPSDVPIARGEWVVRRTGRAHSGPRVDVRTDPRRSRAWTKTPIWTDRARCLVSMKMFPYQEGGTFPDTRISERGRQMLAVNSRH